MSSKSTFCPLPWIFLSLRTNGEYRLCSHANQSPSKGLLYSPGGKLKRADQDPISEVRNAPLAKNARMEMLKGNWPEPCVRCQKEESAGLYSRRQIEGDVWRQFIDLEKAQSMTSVDGEIHSDSSALKHFDIRFGNHCNLKCRSCSPTESSQWLGDHLELWGDKYDESTYSVSISSNERGRFESTPNLYNWHESDHFLEEIKKVLPHMKSIYFAGGEPLLIRRHYELLEICVAKGYAKNLTLEYNTNLTVLPPKILALWSQFSEIKIGISIDGLGTVNDYIRHPSKWATIEKNLDLIDNAPGNFILWMAPTVMKYNILEIPKIMMWKLSKNFKRINNNPDCLFFSAHPLHRPYFLNIQSFPKDIKEKVERYLIASKADILAAVEKAFGDNPVLADGARAQTHNIIDGYISFMHQQDLSEYHEKFWYFSDSLDRLRKESLEESIPVFKDLFKTVELS